jgi:hypothetical protein
MMDSGTQPIMIDKRLALDLHFTANDLAPCPFTIATTITWSITTGYTPSEAYKSTCTSYSQVCGDKCE